MMKLALRPDHEFILNIKALHLVHRFIKGAHHAVDKRMRRFPVIAVKPIVKAAKPDRIKRQAGHISRHINGLIRIQPSPF